MTNDNRWLLAVIVVECAAAAMVVVDGGDSGRRRRRPQGARGEGDTGEGGRGRGRGRGQQGREGEGGRGRAGEDGKQQEWASDGAAWRLRSKINKIGVTTPQYYLFFDVVVCAHLHPKNSGSRVTQLKDR